MKMFFRKKRRREEYENLPGEQSNSKRARTCDFDEPIQSQQQPTVFHNIKTWFKNSWFRKKVSSISDFIQKEVFISPSEIEVTANASVFSTPTLNMSQTSQRSAASTSTPFKFTGKDNNMGIPTPRASLASAKQTSVKQTNIHSSDCVRQKQPQVIDKPPRHHTSSVRNSSHVQESNDSHVARDNRDSHSNQAMFNKENVFNLGRGFTPQPSNSKFSRGAHSRRRKERRIPNSTLKECLRQAERQKYLQLIQQYTSVPVANVKAGVNNPQKDWSFLNRPHKALVERPSTDLTTKLSEAAFSNHLSPQSSKSQVKPSTLFTPKYAVSNLSTFHPEESIFRKPCSTPVENFKNVGENFLSSRFISPMRFSEKKRSVVQQNDVIDLDDTSQEINQSVQVQKPESKFIAEDWIKGLTSKYSTDVLNRQRKIREEEIRIKVLQERREAKQASLESQIRDRMKITDGVVEEPPYVESEEEEEEDEPEEEDEVLPEITEEMRNKIRYAFTGGSSGEVLVDAFKLQITRKDILTLKGLNWLNDEVINFYMNMLMERGENDNYPKVHAFNTFFYPKIVSDGHGGVRRWTRRVDIFAKDYIIIPVHLGVHWCLAIVDFRRKEIRYYDSMGGNNINCLHAIKKYLCDESLDKKKQKFDMSGWNLEVVSDIPQQMNGSDCGMFACKFAEYITRDAPITFDQGHMPYFRERMVYEILTKTLV